jgi:menaquinone-dependent protoporphyrinogen oxidase
VRTLIIYATKHGCTEKCSKLLKDKLQGDIVLVNIKKDSVPDINLFDNIIVGGSIYIGQIQKEIKNFCVKNISILKGKRVGLFICGMNGKEVPTLLKNYFPEELLSSSIAREYFGGEFIFKNMNFFERFIIKKIAKSDKDSSTLSKETINKFAALILS